jgi:putative lipoprotein
MNKTKTVKGSWLLGACFLMLAACNNQEDTMVEAQQKPDNSLMQFVSGEVWYRERMALPPGAKVITVIADYTHVVDGPGPYMFRLVYDPRAIDDRMTYGIRARIEHDGELMFTSTEHIDPFTGEPVRIMVSRTGGN